MNKSLQLTHISVRNLFIFKPKEILCTVINTDDYSVTIQYFEKDVPKRFYMNEKDIEQYLMPIELTEYNIETYLGIRLKMIRKTYPNDEYNDYYDENTHQIQFRETETLVNRVGSTMHIHVDNADFQTIGTADLIYVHELQNFIASLGLDIEDFK